MIVKDFLLSLNTDKLCAVFCDSYIMTNVLLQDVVQKDSELVRRKNKEAVMGFLEQVRNIQPEEHPDKCLIVSKYLDFDYTDDLEMIKSDIYDVFVLHKDECTIKEKLQPVKTMEEAVAQPLIWLPYGIGFNPWELVLGLEIEYLPEDHYAAAAVIIQELTVYSYDKQENENKIKAELDYLDQIQEEIDNGTAEFVEYDAEKFRKEFDLPEKTPEQKARESALLNEIHLANLNISYQIYNFLLDKGTFRND